MITELLKSTTVLGMMSGSSMDGLDLALVRFEENNYHQFEVLAKDTKPYSRSTLDVLKDTIHGSSVDLVKAHIELGKTMGSMAAEFIRNAGERVDLISSHGHTIFHQPSIGLTFQAGSGAEIASITGIDTVCDLRAIDVALGGQGAPLVPLGEKLLFPEHTAFLNLGGIANISFHHDKIDAFDVCHANMILDHLSAELGHVFDENGETARSGRRNEDLLEPLIAAMTKDPNSLGREGFLNSILPLLERSQIPVEDELSTSVEAIARCIAENIPADLKGDILVTGGGAHNAFLVERIQALSSAKLKIPEKPVVDFKEAIIFAFLGLLRVMERPNCLAEVTSSKHDNIGGAVYLGNSNRRS